MEAPVQLEPAPEADQKELKELVAEVQEAAEADAGYVEEAVDVEAKDVAANVDEIKGAVEKNGDETKETVEKTVEEMAAAEHAPDAPLLLVTEKQETDVTTDDIKEVVEKAEENVEASEKKEALVTPLIVVLEKKGIRKTVEFTYQPVGFAYCQLGSGCCGPKSKASVKVSKVEPKQQAASLGVESGAIICQVNGKDIAHANQLRDLLAQYLPTLPKAEVCN